MNQPATPVTPALITLPGAIFTRFRAAYGRLHDALSDCLESGRLKEADLPDDHKALALLCVECVGADHQLDEALKAPNGTLSPADRQEIADLMETAADRYKDTLENPLELPHYSAEDVTEMQRKRDRALHFASLFSTP